MKIGNVTFRSGTLLISLGIIMSLLIIGTVITTLNSASASTKVIKPPVVRDEGNNNITRTQVIGSGTLSGVSSGTSGTLQR
jgi:hypothetical protein